MMIATPTATAAIAAALSHNWKEAIHINTLLLKTNPNDIAALNRMGYAYTQNGQRALAKTTFEKVLKLDPYNQIALKHTKNLGSVRKKSASSAHSTSNHISPLSFLEEPGVTKIVACVNLAPAQTLNTITPGMEMTLKTKNHCVEVRLLPNTYVAALPDDLSFKLLRLMASGNAYQAIVKSVDKKSLILIIRELTRGKKFANQPSFTAATISLSGSPIREAVDHEGEKTTGSNSEDADATEEEPAEESE
ncbi:tetratricopeptide repeat protein [Candidatus Gottesmanbacteria bacterium]|nr:tetratricopeptide repeat protein [Candidatus Gottesmanbacteria bacterium]